MAQDSVAAIKALWLRTGWLCFNYVNGRVEEVKLWGLFLFQFHIAKRFIWHKFCHYNDRFLFHCYFRHWPWRFYTKTLNYQGNNGQCSTQIQHNEPWVSFFFKPLQSTTHEVYLMDVSKHNFSFSITAALCAEFVASCWHMLAYAAVTPSRWKRWNVNGHVPHLHHQSHCEVYMQALG